jgi:elongation factor P
MLDVGDLRRGHYILYQGSIYKVIEANKHFMGRGSGLIRTRLKDVKTGLIKEVTFPSGEKVEEADISFQKHWCSFKKSKVFYNLQWKVLWKNIQ